MGLGVKTLGLLLLGILLIEGEMVSPFFYFFPNKGVSSPTFEFELWMSLESEKNSKFLESSEPPLEWLIAFPLVWDLKNS